MISNKNRLKTGTFSVLNRASAGIGIAGLSGLATVQLASAQTNFQLLPGADYVVDPATGTARVTYQGQLYQVNAGHYIINADGSINISSQAAATVAPGLTSTTVNTSGLPVDSSVLNVAADSSGGLFGGNNLLLGTSVLGVAAVGLGGYFLYQSLNDDDEDDIAPTMEIDFDDNTLGLNQETTVTFTASEVISGFTAADVEAAGGELGALQTSDNQTFTATFTADDTSTAPSVSIAADKFTDSAGNKNTAVAAITGSKDSSRPTIEIEFDDDTLGLNQETTITFTASEVISGFTAADVVAVGGALGALQTSDNQTFTATFTADDTSTAPSVSIAADKFTDSAGNKNTAVAAITGSKDSSRPTMTIAFTDDDGDEVTTVAAGQTLTVTFTPSEAITGFDHGDVLAAGGTLGDLTSNQDGTFTATFSTDETSTDPNITIADSSFTDDAGNGNIEASASVTKDIVAPTMEMAFIDDTLGLNQETTVIFTASEVISGFTAEDVITAGGDLGDLQTSDNKTFFATFTKNDDDVDPSISIATDKFTDGAGNQNAAIGPVSGTRDIIVPTMTIAFTDGNGNVPALAAGETVNVTFTASEEVTGFTAEDVIAEGGTLSNWDPTDNQTFTATFSAEEDWTEDFTVVVAANAFSDLFGNQNAKVETTLALDPLPTNDVYYLPDQAFDETGAFDASTVSDFSELRYVGDGISSTLSITGIADNTTISISSQNNNSGTLNLTAADGVPTISVALNGSTSSGVSLGTLNLGAFAGTLNLSSIGAGTNLITTLNTSGAIVVNGSGDAAQALTITEVGADVTSIDASGFTAALTVTGVAAAGSGNTATSLDITGGDGNDDLVGGNGGGIIHGHAGDDIITGGTSADTLTGGDGADDLAGDDGNDTIDGGDGDDNLMGGNGVDNLSGGDGNDTITGGAGDDTIDGGDGEDEITGGAGKDEITGGAGADTFVFNAGDTGAPDSGTFDTVNDFYFADDKIRLTNQSLMGDGAHGNGEVQNGVYVFESDPASLGDAIGDIRLALGDTANVAVFFHHGSHTYAYASFTATARADDVLVRLEDQPDAVTSISAGTGGDTDLFTLA